MRKLFSVGILAAIVVAAIAVPFVAHAESSSSVFPLVFCGRSGQPDCTVCDLLVLVDKVKNLIFLFIIPVIGAILVVVAGLFFIFGGQYPEYQKKAKALLTSVAVGVGIIALAWLFTNTILQSLAKGDDVSNSWTHIECTGPATTLPPGGGGTIPTTQPTSQPTPTPGQTTQPTTTPSPTTQPTSQPTPTGGLSESAARAYLASHGIGVNAQPPRTTLVGIRQETLDAIVLISQRCGCDVVVTAGTESGHEPGAYSHSAGYKVDLRLNPELEAAIRELDQLPTRSDGAQQWEDPVSGAVYALEGDHWDVVVK